MTAEQQAAQTREGYVEIITMADIHPMAADIATGAATATPNPLFTAIMHSVGVPPCSVAAMNRLSANPPAALGVDGAYDLGLRAPTTGLLANWIVINVPQSGAASGQATAIAATAASGQPARGNIVFSPQIGAVGATPDLQTADPAFRTNAGAANGDVQNGSSGAYTAGVTPILTALQLDLPDLSTPYTLLNSYPPSYIDAVTQANNLSTALATFYVKNEFLTDTTITAFTDWVLAQPTRRYHVTLDYRNGVPGSFGRAYNASVFYSAANVQLDTGRACVNVAGPRYSDREAFSSIFGATIGGIPVPPQLNFYCGAVGVMVFNTTGPSALGAELTRRSIDTGLVQSGWASLYTSGATGNGLPIIGRSFIRATNPAVTPGIAANFGGGFEHRYVPLVP
ncbi:MAG: hypothetical protein EOO54_27230 [Haliea sp.]|nr:MAG: hypothetical protein EOO54_27230 [Haliea sp.]